jgi:drug/metabolite transporter (DMT)-like permease
MPARSHLTRGYALSIASAAILSTTPIFIRHLTTAYSLPALILAAWRDLFVFLVLLTILAALRRPLIRLDRRQVVFLLCYGLVLALFNAIWTLSVTYNGASISTVLAYCSVAFSVLLGRWFLKERLDWGKGMAVILTLGGCVLVSNALDPSAWRLNLAGILTGFFSGFWYAMYSLMGRAAFLRGLNPWTTMLYTFLFAAIFLLVFNWSVAGVLPGAAARIDDFLWLGRSWSGWGLLFLLAAGPTLAGYGLYNTSLTHLPAGVVNLVLTIEPVLTALQAYLLFDERLIWLQISLLILSGVVFLRWHEGRQERSNRSIAGVTGQKG